jgi:hypothetical protein
MDDMRQRYRVPRRDFTRPIRQPAPAEPKPTVIPPKPLAQAPTQAHVPPALAHAYQSPPRPALSAREPHQPNHHSQTAHHHHAVGATVKPARKKRRWFKKMLITLVILSVLGGGAALAYAKLYNANPFSEDISSQAQISLFYPKKLPAGYTINKSSIHLDNNVLTYAAAKADLRLVFTIEPAPANFNFGYFNKQYLTNTQSVSNPYSTAVVGLNKDRYLGNFISGKTWFILTTNSPSVSASDLSLVIGNLKKY